MPRTPGLESSISTKRRRIAELAQASPTLALTTLAHHMDLAWMQEAYRRTRKDGATGVDHQTAAEFAENLDGNLRALLEAAKSGRYQAPPVRRAYISKTDGRRRPIGIDLRRQGASTCRGDAVGTHLRDGLSGLLVRVSSGAICAGCLGRAVGADDGHIGWVGVGIRYRKLLRCDQTTRVDAAARATRPFGGSRSPRRGCVRGAGLRHRRDLVSAPLTSQTWLLRGSRTFPWRFLHERASSPRTTVCSRAWSRVNVPSRASSLSLA